MTENKRFVLERSDYDLKYEFSVADTSKVEKTKEDFWNEEEEIYEYRKYITYLLKNDAFLTLEEADELLNALHEENQELKSELKVYRKVASCSNCEYHNYNWYDDGDEFEVCDKGNDVTEGICKEWRGL